MATAGIILFVSGLVSLPSGLVLVSLGKRKLASDAFIGGVVALFLGAVFWFLGNPKGW